MKINIDPSRPFAIDPQEVFPQVEKICYNLAWKFAKQHPFPTEEAMFEECKSQAYVAFMAACQDYTPGRKTKFSSWCYYWVWCQLKDYITLQSKSPLSFIEIDDELLGAAPSLRVESLELIDDLSADAKEIVLLITETPADLLGGLPTTTKQLMKIVKDYMVTKRGRSMTAVNAAHKELQTRFTEAWA